MKKNTNIHTIEKHTKFLNTIVKYMKNIQIFLQLLMKHTDIQQTT